MEVIERRRQDLKNKSRPTSAPEQLYRFLKGSAGSLADVDLDQSESSNAVSVIKFTI